MRGGSGSSACWVNGRQTAEEVMAGATVFGAGSTRFTFPKVRTPLRQAEALSRNATDRRTAQARIENVIV